MVKISRPNPRGRRMGGKLSSILTLRNMLIFLVSAQCFRMMTMDTYDSGGTDNGGPTDKLGFIRKTEPNRVDDRRPGQVPKKDDNKNDGKNGEEIHMTKNDDDNNDDDNNDDEKGKERNSGDEKSGTKTLEKQREIITDAPDRNDADSHVDLNSIVIEKKGTGSTSVGYVKDFVYERDNPDYRKVEAPGDDLSPTVAKLINEKSVLPCYDEATGSMNPRCSDQDTPLVAYNSASFHRTWCGQEIKPNSAVVMTEHCTDPIAHLFQAEVPPITGEHMPPIVIKSNSNRDVEDVNLEKVMCNIPCQQEKGLNLDGIKNGVKELSIGGEKWKITMTMDPSKSKMERTDYMKDHYYSTQSLISSVPLSTFDSKIHSLRNRPAVDFETTQEKAIYLVNDKCSAFPTKRNRWFDAVREKIPVDSYGSCGHNVEVPQGMTIGTPEGRIALSKQYRIVLAFDETKEKDHISDIVWEALVSGAVPVVVGADNLRNRLPPNSFINVNDFSKWEELGDHVKKVVSDKDLWLSYHKWRDDKEAVEAFEKQYEFTQTDPTCRLCRWAYAKKYGLGWDHTKQEVRSISKVPKDEFCSTADYGLVTRPFSEQWVTRRSGESNEKVFKEDSEGESCSSLEADGGVVVDSFKCHRRVVQHDGVTDFIITELTNDIAGSEVILRLKFPGVRNPDGACFYNTHSLVSTAMGSKIGSASIQDDLVKITVLANWDTTVKSSGEGIMEITIENDGNSKTEGGESAQRRVRVIVEEMISVHDKMTEFFPSSFSKLMTMDFINPIGVFFVDS